MEAEAGHGQLGNAAAQQDREGVGGPGPHQLPHLALPGKLGQGEHMGHQGQHQPRQQAAQDGPLSAPLPQGLHGPLEEEVQAPRRHPRGDEGNDPLPLLGAYGVGPGKPGQAAAPAKGPGQAVQGQHPPGHPQDVNKDPALFPQQLFAIVLLGAVGLQVVHDAEEGGPEDHPQAHRRAGLCQRRRPVSPVF